MYIRFDYIFAITCVQFFVISQKKRPHHLNRNPHFFNVNIVDKLLNVKYEMSHKNIIFEEILPAIIILTL